MEGLLLLILLGAFYFLPTIVANSRNHHSSGAIFVLNLFLGWTFLGWVLALVWSFSYVIPEAAPKPAGEAPPVAIAPSSEPSNSTGSPVPALVIIGLVFLGALGSQLFGGRSSTKQSPTAPTSKSAPVAHAAESGWKPITTTTAPEVVASFVAPIAKPVPSQPKANKGVHDIGIGSTTAAQRRDYVVESRMRVKVKMPDPSSVRFKDTFFSGAAGIPFTCGWVNGKNKSGRYIGFRRFVATAGPQAIVLIDDGSNRHWILGEKLPNTGRQDIENTWNRFCVAR